MVGVARERREKTSNSQLTLNAGGWTCASWGRAFLQESVRVSQTYYNKLVSRVGIMAPESHTFHLPTHQLPLLKQPDAESARENQTVKNRSGQSTASKVTPMWPVATANVIMGFQLV